MVKGAAAAHATEATSGTSIVRCKQCLAAALLLLVGISVLLLHAGLLTHPLEPSTTVCQLLQWPSRPLIASTWAKQRKESVAKDPTAGYTVVLSTFARDELLVQNIQHWQSCPHVDQVQVIWHDPKRIPPPSVVDAVKLDSRVKLLLQSEDRLTNRFRIDFGTASDALLTVDDDVTIDCRAATAAFEIWHPDRMVGFAPRRFDVIDAEGYTSMYLDSYKPGGGRAQGYDWDTPCRRGVSLCGIYNTLWVTKGAFLHKRFYKMLLTEERYAAARALVNRYTTGEDMLMSIVFGGREVVAVTTPPRFKRSFEIDEMRKTGKNSPGVVNTSLGARTSSFRPLIRAELAKHGVKLLDRSAWYVVDQGWVYDPCCSTTHRQLQLRCGPMRASDDSPLHRKRRRQALFESRARLALLVSSIIVPGSVCLWYGLCTLAAPTFPDTIKQSRIKLRTIEMK
jgi:hypothetical protein